MGAWHGPIPGRLNRYTLKKGRHKNSNTPASYECQTCVNNLGKTSVDAEDPQIHAQDGRFDACNNCGIDDLVTVRINEEVSKVLLGILDRSKMPTSTIPDAYYC